jgi:hypothetical protein
MKYLQASSACWRGPGAVVGALLMAAAPPARLTMQITSGSVSATASVQNRSAQWP